MLSPEHPKFSMAVFASMLAFQFAQIPIGHLLYYKTKNSYFTVTYTVTLIQTFHVEE